MENNISHDEFEKQISELKAQIETLKDAEKLNYTLFDIASAVNTTRNLEELSARIHKSLCRLMDLPNFFIAIYNANKGIIEFVYCMDQKCKYEPIKENLEDPQSLTGQVIASQKPLFFKEAYLLDRERQNKVIGATPKIWLGVPLIVRQKVIGAIAVQDYSDPDYFSQKDMDLLSAVSDQIAIAVERKQILEIIEKNERTQRLITENTSSMIAIVDRYGNYEYVNPAHGALGYSAEEMIGKTSFDFMHPDDIESMVRLLEKALNKEIKQIYFQFRVKHKNGLYHAIEGSFDSITDNEGNLEKIIFIGEDITLRKKAEKALQESEEKFRLIFQTSPDLIVICRLEDCVVIDINNVFVKYLKSNHQDVIGKKFSELGILDDIDAFNEFISMVKTTGEVNNYEITLALEGVKKRAILISAKVTSLDNIPHAIIIARDVSRHKILEAQLRQRQKMDTIGTLAAGIAHDFNNILAGIMGSLDLMLTEKKNLNTDQRENINNAITSSKRAAKLIKQLQVFSKSSESQKESVDVYPVIKDVFDILKQTTNPLIEKQLVIQKDQVFVYGFEDELYQVVMNLCMNGIQAIEEKERLENEFIRIWAKIPDKDDDNLPSWSDQNFIQICFQDSGPGMDEDTKQKAFDPMFSTKQMGDRKGQGLGLAIVYNIVTRKHGGFVSIDTVEGHGTCCSIFLPLAEKKPEEKKKPAESPEGHGTILVIEDEEIVRKIAVKALRLFGYKTHEAVNGIAGLELFMKYRTSIDAVLLDLIMPGKSGVEVLQEMLNIDPDVKVIIASGQINDQEPVDVLNKAKAYISKPYHIKNLKEIVSSVLS